MRVIAGKSKGRKLQTLFGDKVRPTSDKIKEAVFSMLQFEIEGRSFLDLFAGSGQIGIEALSRGASKAVFVDSNRDSIKVIKNNLLNTNLNDLAKVVNRDSYMFLKGNFEKFDIIYLDPPYITEDINKILPFISSVINEGGVIICETPVGKELPEIISNFSIFKKRKYGKIKITVYKEEGSA